MYCPWPPLARVVVSTLPGDAFTLGRFYTSARSRVVCVAVIMRFFIVCERVVVSRTRDSPVVECRDIVMTGPQWCMVHSLLTPSAAAAGSAPRPRQPIAVATESDRKR
jgi:hypothetical protein